MFSASKREIKKSINILDIYAILHAIHIFLLISWGNIQMNRNIFFSPLSSSLSADELKNGRIPMSQNNMSLNTTTSWRIQDGAKPFASKEGRKYQRAKITLYTVYTMPIIHVKCSILPLHVYWKQYLRNIPEGWGQKPATRHTLRAGLGAGTSSHSKHGSPWLHKIITVSIGALLHVYMQNTSSYDAFYTSKH